MKKKEKLTDEFGEEIVLNEDLDSPNYKHMKSQNWDKRCFEKAHRDFKLNF
mgnify:FL=1